MPFDPARIPLDALFLILSRLPRDNYETLCACSRVSRAFASAVAPMLYHRVEILGFSVTKARGNRGKVIKFVKARAPPITLLLTTAGRCLAVHVREVVLRGDLCRRTICFSNKITQEWTQALELCHLIRTLTLSFNKIDNSLLASFFSILGSPRHSTSVATQPLCASSEAHPARILNSSLRHLKVMQDLTLEKISHLSLLRNTGLTHVSLTISDDTHGHMQTWFKEISGTLKSLALRMDTLKQKRKACEPGMLVNGFMADAIEHLKGLEVFAWAPPSGTDMEEVIKYVCRMPGLIQLDLWMGKISEAGIDQASPRTKLSCLKRFSLSCTSATLSNLHALSCWTTLLISSTASLETLNVRDHSPDVWSAVLSLGYHDQRRRSVELDDDLRRVLLQSANTLQLLCLPFVKLDGPTFRLLFERCRRLSEIEVGFSVAVWNVFLCTMATSPKHLHTVRIRSEDPLPLVLAPKTVMNIMENGNGRLQRLIYNDQKWKGKWSQEGSQWKFGVVDQALESW